MSRSKFQDPEAHRILPASALVRVRTRRDNRAQAARAGFESFLHFQHLSPKQNRKVKTSREEKRSVCLAFIPAELPFSNT